MKRLIVALGWMLAGPAAAEAPLRFVAGPGAEAIAQVLAATAQADRASVVADLGRDYDGITEVRVALSREGFRDLLPPGRPVPDWAQGVAFADLNLVVVRAAPGDADPRATLRHELSHVAVGRLAAHPVPRWFLEGLATIQAGDVWQRQGPSLVRAALGEGLFSFEALDEGFPSRASEAELAYAQSADFVQFLVDRRGLGAMDDLLHRMVAGAYFDDAFTDALGQTRRSAENEWRRSLARWELAARFLTSGDLLWSAVGLLALWGVFVLRRRNRLRLRAMEEQERAEAAQAFAQAAAEWAAARGAPAEPLDPRLEDAPDPALDPADADDDPPDDPGEDGAAAAKKPTLH